MMYSVAGACTETTLAAGNSPLAEFTVDTAFIQRSL